MTLSRIPFNRVSLLGNEMAYLHEALGRGHISGGGYFSALCEDFLAREVGVARALLTTSCTHALEMAAILLEILPGDEVIMPSFTFPSTANAFVLRGARPVFCDIRPDTLNLDEKALKEHLTSATRAIVPVNYAGVGCEMDEILTVCNANGLALVEDNAHGLFGSYKDRPLGSFGSLATQSFHETKNVTCGEGGALLIADPALVERAEILREKGTDRSRFSRGEVDKYTWVDIGSSFQPSELLAAFLYGQLEVKDQIMASRERIWEAYYEGLRDWAHQNGVILPTVPAHCKQAYHLFYFLLPHKSDRSAVISHLRTRGILAVFHYQPLHLSKMGKSFGGCRGQLGVTEDVCDRLVRLPLYVGMSPEDVELVISAVTDFKPSGGRRALPQGGGSPSVF